MHMKTLLKNVWIFSSMALCLSWFYSCDSEVDDNAEIIKNSFRIKQIITSGAEAHESKQIFSYEDTKVVNVLNYDMINNTWKECYKTVIRYSDNKISVTNYDRTPDGWELDRKHELIFKDDLLIEEENFEYKESEWLVDSKFSYEYSNKNIINIKGYYNESSTGISIVHENMEFIYNQDNLVEFKNYYLNSNGEWDQNERILYSYSDKKLTSFTEYNKYELGNWEYGELKGEYLYAQDKVSEIKYFYWGDKTNKWVYKNSAYFKYNEAGYLIEKVDDVEDYTETYEYEEGNGNIDIFKKLDHRFIRPNPTYKSVSIQKK